MRKGKLYVLTLGHNGKAHNPPAYKALFKNAISWFNKD